MLQRLKLKDSVRKRRKKKDNWQRLLLKLKELDWSKKKQIDLPKKPPKKKNV